MVNYKVKKRILLFCQLPPPIHGVTMMNQYILKNKNINFKYNVDYISLNYAKSIESVGSLNVLKILKYIKYCFHLIFVLIFKRPHLVYFTITPCGPAFLRDSVYVFIMKLFRVKILFHLHGKGIKNYYNKPIYNLFYKISFSKENIIILSEKLQYDIADIEKYNKIYFLPNGIEQHTLKRRTNTDNFRVLFLSNLLETKGPMDLLYAAHEIIKQGYIIKFDFVGAFSDERFKNDFFNFINANNLSSYVNYLGIKVDNEKNAVYNNSNIFVFPTYYDRECFPLSILEAMSFGLPVISTNEGAISEIVDDNINGFIVDKRDIQQLVDRILFLYNNRDKLNDFGNSSFEKFKNNYSLEIFENNFKNIVDKVME